MTIKKLKEIQEEEKGVLIENVAELKAEPLEQEVVEYKRMSRDDMKKKEDEEKLKSWQPKTKVGKLVKEGKIKNIDEALKDYKIIESEIIDTLVKTKTDFLNIGQSKGKFGGGKRRIWRQTQRKTCEGNVPTFSCLVAVGDENGHVGIGLGRAKETLPAKEKSIRNAKLGIIRVARGCASFDCSCNEKHTIPMKVTGKCGSVNMILTPAPQGTGLVIGDECKRILRLAGIKDIYSQTFGQTRTTINVAKACMDALKKLSNM